MENIKDSIIQGAKEHPKYPGVFYFERPEEKTSSIIRTKKTATLITTDLMLNLDDVEYIGPVNNKTFDDEDVKIIIKFRDTYSTYGEKVYITKEIYTKLMKDANNAIYVNS